MSKVLNLLLSAFVLLSATFLTTTPAYAAQSCSSVGINLTDPNPPQLPEGLSTYTFKFSGPSDGTYQLSFGAANQGHSDQQDASGGNLSLTVTTGQNNSSGEFKNDPNHTGTLQKKNGNSWETICDMSYRVGFTNNACTLSWDPPAPKDNDHITLSTKATQTGVYTICLSANPVGTMNVNSNGAGSQTIGPFSPVANAPLFLTVPGQGCFTTTEQAIPQYCSTNITIKASGGNPSDTGQCSITPSNTPGDADQIGLTASSVSKNTNYQVNWYNSTDPNPFKTTNGKSDDNGTVTIYYGGTLVKDQTYTANLVDASGKVICGHGFTVGGGITGGPDTVPGFDKNNAADAGGAPQCDPKSPSIGTAIGCIHTSPAEFVTDLLKFIVGIAGGFAFLMMLFGAFQMITSAGNPDTLHAGRERLTSAIIGLLFVIFAVLLLQIIGVDILKLPGFIKG